MYLLPSTNEPVDFQVIEKAGPHFTEVGEDSQQSLTTSSHLESGAVKTASSPAWMHLISQYRSTGLTLLTFPSTAQLLTTFL